MQTFAQRVLSIVATGICVACGSQQSRIMEPGRIVQPETTAEPAFPSKLEDSPAHSERFEHESKMTFRATDRLRGVSAEPFVVPTGKYLISDHFSCAGNNLRSGAVYIVNLVVSTSGNAKAILPTGVPTILLSGEGASIDQEVEINADAGSTIQVLGKADGGSVDDDSSINCQLAGYLFDVP